MSDEIDHLEKQSEALRAALRDVEQRLDGARAAAEQAKPKTLGESWAKVERFGESESDFRIVPQGYWLRVAGIEDCTIAVAEIESHLADRINAALALQRKRDVRWLSDNGFGASHALEEQPLATAEDDR